MAEAPQKTQPPEQMHWGIVYLREDIQDLRAAGVRLDGKLDDVYSKLDAKIDTRAQESLERDQALDAKIDARAQESLERDQALEARIDARAQESLQRDQALEAKIDDVYTKLDAKIDTRAQESLERDQALEARIDARAQESLERDQALAARIDRVETKVDDLQRVIREQSTVLTQRMVMITGMVAGLMTTVIVGAMKL